MIIAVIGLSQLDIGCYLFKILIQINHNHRQLIGVTVPPHTTSSQNRTRRKQCALYACRQACFFCVHAEKNMLVSMQECFLCLDQFCRDRTVRVLWYTHYSCYVHTHLEHLVSIEQVWWQIPEVGRLEKMTSSVRSPRNDVSWLTKVNIIHRNGIHGDEVPAFPPDLAFQRNLPL